MTTRTKYDASLVTTRETAEAAQQEADRLCRVMSHRLGRYVSLLVGPVTPAAPDDLEIWGVFYDKEGSEADVPG